MKYLLIFSGLLFAASLEASPIYSASTYALGTEVEMKMAVDNSQRAQVCFDIFNTETRALENLLSAYIEESDISRLKHSDGRWMPISRDTYDILEASKEVSVLSHGAFDITVGALVKLWSVDQKSARVPSAEEIRRALRYVDYRKVETKREGSNYFARLGKEQQITVGAIGKGFIADKVMERMLAKGCDNTLINYGGNVYAHGFNGTNAPWRIGLQEPALERGNFFATIDIRDESVVTSGDYEKYFVKDGIKYHHILDPRTGDPVPATLSSVTIIDKSSTFADAMCTALFVMGWKESLLYLSKHPDIRAVLVNEALDTIAYTKNLEKSLNITNPKYKKEIIEPSVP